MALPAIAILWCAVRTGAIVRAILAFAILAGHGRPPIKNAPQMIAARRILFRH